jgi:proteasome accessory factor B
MKRNKPQFSRLLELDRSIRAGKYPNCLSFAATYECSQKTVQRDIDYLKDQLGAPLAYDRGKQGYYYTSSSWFLPSLSLSEGDLLALLVGSKALEQYRGTPMAAQVERVFAKLAGMLPDKISIRPELVFNRFSFTSPPTKPIDENIWTCLVRGLLTQTVVKMVYRSFEAQTSKAVQLSPYHIANLQGEWYVFGFSDVHGELRQFAMPRVEKATLTEKHFDLPADFDPAEMLAKTFGRFVLGESTHAVRLLFDKEIAPWVLERQWHPKQKVSHRKNGDVELAIEVTGLFEVFRWVLAWGHHVTVLAPKELVTMVADEVQLMATKNGRP